MTKTNIILYDIIQLPSGFTFDDLHKFIKEDRECFYDSSKGGIPPNLIDIGGGDLLDVKFIDINEIKINGFNLENLSGMGKVIMYQHDREFKSAIL